MVKVELIYAPQGKEIVHLHLDVAEQASVAAVIEISNLAQQFPEVTALPVGIFSKIVSREQKVKNGDRIEIYRQLLIDPKEKRKRRVRGK